MRVGWVGDVSLVVYVCGCQTPHPESENGKIPGRYYGIYGNTEYILGISARTYFQTAKY